MTHKLFIEIEKFDNWARVLSVVPQNDRGGEWECNYENWDSIYDAFADFIGTTQPEHWTKYERERILYIIARDNEISRRNENTIPGYFSPNAPGTRLEILRDLA